MHALTESAYGANYECPLVSVFIARFVAILRCRKMATKFSGCGWNKGCGYGTYRKPVLVGLTALLAYLICPNFGQTYRYGAALCGTRTVHLGSNRPTEAR